MSVRKSSEYRREVTRDPFQLMLDSGQTVTFADPNQMDTESSFELAEIATTRPRRAAELLLGGDFAAWWDEWRYRPAEETGKLIEDAMTHYGAEPGKPSALPA